MEAKGNINFMHMKFIHMNHTVGTAPRTRPNFCILHLIDCVRVFFSLNTCQFFFVKVTVLVDLCLLKD